MSTRLSASARLGAACRAQLSEHLGLPLDPAAALGRLDVFLDSERIDVLALREMVSTHTVRSVLGTLAPGEFGRACGLLAGPGVAVPDQHALAASALTELAAAVAAAGARLATATRDIIAGAFTRAAAELDYTVSVCRGATATGVELRRENELVLLRIKDGGDVDVDHAGLIDAVSGQQQLGLEQAIEHRGITLTKRRQRYHDAADGGELIAAAAARGDASLARATVLDTEADTSVPARRAATGARAAGGRPQSPGLLAPATA
jgi:hypothetical protein